MPMAFFGYKQCKDYFISYGQWFSKNCCWPMPEKYLFKFMNTCLQKTIPLSKVNSACSCKMLSTLHETTCQQLVGGHICHFSIRLVALVPNLKENVGGGGGGDCM